MRSPRAPPRGCSREPWRHRRSRRRPPRRDAEAADAGEQEAQMLDQQQDAERGAHNETRGAPLYRRPMPGGGYVEVELDASPADAALSGSGGPLRGWIVMERRADPGRRYGHSAPVVAELASDDHDE